MVRPSPALARKVAESNLGTLLLFKTYPRFSPLVGWPLHALKGVAAVCRKRSVLRADQRLRTQ